MRCLISCVTDLKSQVEDRPKLKYKLILYINHRKLILEVSIIINKVKGKEVTRIGQTKPRWGKKVIRHCPIPNAASLGVI